MERNDPTIEVLIKQHLAQVRILARRLSGQGTGKAEIYHLIGTLAKAAEGMLAGQIDQRMVAALDRVADSLDTVLEADQDRFRPVRFVRTA